MNEMSNKLQTPHGDDIGQQEQQSPPASTANQQGTPEGSYQQGLLQVQGEYPQYTPPGGYQQYGYQQYSPGQQQSGYQQQYSAQHMGDAGLLCYLFGWVSGLIFLLLERENHFVRFHAMQSLLFFGILGVLEEIFSHLPLFGPIGGVLGLVMFIGWIVMMVKAHRGEYYKLPLFGDLAERLIGQIRV